MARTPLVVCSLAAAVLAACSGSPPPECVVVDTSCAPGYVPTFTNVYKNTLEAGCGAARSACHSARGRAGGLSLADQATAYQELLDATKRRVRPGDPACSPLIVRVEGIGEDYQMPTGDPLSAPARCAILQWVLQGAQP